MLEMTGTINKLNKNESQVLDTLKVSWNLGRFELGFRSKENEESL